METSLVRRAGVAALGFGVLAWAARDARADGLTFLPDDPAGVSIGIGGVGGSATTTDGEFGFDGTFQSAAAWTVSPSHLELAIEQRTSTEPVFPICLTAGAFVFTVDSPQTYAISGHYAYFPHVEGTDAFGYGYAIFNLKDATNDVYLFRNTLDGAASSGTTFEVGEDTGDETDYVEGSLVGTLLPGRVYVFDFWVQTINFDGGPAVAAESVVRIDVEPPGVDELVAWAEEIAAAVEATPLSEVAAPNAASAAGRIGSLVERVEQAADAIEDGDVAAARALLSSVRDRIDGVAKPEDWLDPSPEQAALLAQVDVLLAALD